MRIRSHIIALNGSALARRVAGIMGSAIATVYVGEVGCTFISVSPPPNSFATIRIFSIMFTPQPDDCESEQQQELRA